MSERCSRVLRSVHAEIERELRRLRQQAARPLSVLDVGCWEGEATTRYGEILGGQMKGIEVFPAQAGMARGRGVDVAELDLESEVLPWDDGTVDVVIANQVFEHLKNIWLPMAEMARVLAPGGYLVFSVPNLASLHNRVLLAAGRQPSSIRTFGPHVRGYTFQQARDFVGLSEFYRIERVIGVGFYPLPSAVAAPLARTWPSGSHTPIIVARRLAPAGTGEPWREHYDAARRGSEQTFYS